MCKTKLGSVQVYFQTLYQFGHPSGSLVALCLLHPCTLFDPFPCVPPVAYSSIFISFIASTCATSSKSPKLSTNTVSLLLCFGHIRCTFLQCLPFPCKSFNFTTIL